MVANVEIDDTTYPLPDNVLAYFNAATVPLTLSDRRVPDQPLLAINDAFMKLTGYDEGEAIGRNCRFLQPEGGAGPVRERIRAFIDGKSRGESRFVVPNVARNGRRFVNLLFLTRIGWKGETPLLLGAQFDLTRFSGANNDLFEQAKREDMSPQRLIAGDTGHAIAGTLQTLAASAGLIMQSRFDTAEFE